jgi:hypothetical protein
MSRSAYIPLERTEHTVLQGVAAARAARRRATLEEQLLVAYTAGDARRASELRAAIAQLEAEVG